MLLRAARSAFLRCAAVFTGCHAVALASWRVEEVSSCCRPAAAAAARPAPICFRSACLLMPNKPLTDVQETLVFGTALAGVVGHALTLPARERLKRWMLHPLLPRAAQAGCFAGAYACVSMAAHALDLHALVDRWKEQEEEKAGGQEHASTQRRQVLQPVLPMATDRTVQWLAQAGGANRWLDASLRYVGDGEQMRRSSCTAMCSMPTCATREAEASANPRNASVPAVKSERKHACCAGRSPAEPKLYDSTRAEHPLSPASHTHHDPQAQLSTPPTTS